MAINLLAYHAHESAVLQRTSSDSNLDEPEAHTLGGTDQSELFLSASTRASRPVLAHEPNVMSVSMTHYPTYRHDPVTVYDEM